MTVTTNDPARGIVVSVEGSAQIGDVEAIAAEFRCLLPAGSALVTLSLDSVSRADVSFFQLVAALRLTLEASGRRLAIGRLPFDHVVPRTAELLGIGFEGLASPSGVTG